MSVLIRGLKLYDVNIHEKNWVKGNFYFLKVEGNLLRMDNNNVDTLYKWIF